MILKSSKKKYYYDISVYIALILLSVSSLAEIPGSDPTPLDRPSLPKLDNVSPPTQVLPTLPKLPPLPKEDLPLSSVARIYIKKFHFEGNNVFSEEKLAKIAQSYEQRELTAEQLQEIKNEITNAYIQEGYINSGAIIPDQKVNDGVVTIKIIEGKLFQVEVSGNKSLRTSYIRKRLENYPKDKILNINSIQEKLQLLQQNSLFKRINAELGPGVKLGEGILKIHVDEARPYQLQFSFNNHRSPSVGAYRGELEGWHRNFTGLFGKGWGDTLYIRYGLTEGLNDYTLRYLLPLSHYGTTLSFNVERSDSEVIESPFNQLDVESEADTYAITLNHPLLKKPNKSLELALKLEKRTSKTFLLGRPFSFSPGVRQGESDISVIRFSQDWLDRSRIHVLAARSSFNFGVDALDSTINDDGSPDSKFFTWLGQFQYVRRLDSLKNEHLKMSQILFRIDLQWADQDLLPLEKFSIGGASTVRGYRENQLTRDSGLISSLEWRIPVWRLPISGLSKNPEDGRLEIAPFMDYGRAWNADSDTPTPKDIYSIGLGLRWAPNQDIHTELYWGKALRDLPEPEDKDWQDNGVHFELSVLF